MTNLNGVPIVFNQLCPKGVIWKDPTSETLRYVAHSEDNLKAMLDAGILKDGLKVTAS